MSVIATLQRANHGSQFRAYGLRGAAELIDPFIGVDHAWMSGPTFPPHRHAGFSAVSYVFLDSETGIDNRDSLGTRNLIRPGGLHWAAAGSGIVHQEDPAEVEKTVHSLQIFVNLAPAIQNMPPFVLSLEPEDIPLVQMPGARIRVPLGAFGEVRSPLKPPTEVTMLDISLEEGSVLELVVPAGEGAFAMPIFGEVMVDGEGFSLDGLKLPVYRAHGQPRMLKLQAMRGPAMVVFFRGVPLFPTSN